MPWQGWAQILLRHHIFNLGICILPGHVIDGSLVGGLVGLAIREGLYTSLASRWASGGRRNEQRDTELEFLSASPSLKRRTEGQQPHMQWLCSPTIDEL